MYNYYGTVSEYMDIVLEAACDTPMKAGEARSAFADLGVDPPGFIFRTNDIDDIKRPAEVVF